MPLTTPLLILPVFILWLRLWIFLIKHLLPLPTIPLQRPANTVDPIFTPPPRRHHVREGVSGRGDRHVVAGAELDSVCVSDGVEGWRDGNKKGNYRSRPSKLAHELARALYGTPIRKTIVSGKITGRKLRVCAHIAVTRITGFSGWHNEPPAARL